MFGLPADDHAGKAAGQSINGADSSNETSPLKMRRAAFVFCRDNDRACVEFFL
jgi:hypothetical protein